LSNFDEILIFSTTSIFEKYPNIALDNIPSGGRRVVRCGRTDRYTRTWRSQKSLFAVFGTRLKAIFSSRESNTASPVVQRGLVTDCFWITMSSVCRPLENIWTSLLSVTSFTVSLHAGYVIQQCSSAWFYNLPSVELRTCKGRFVRPSHVCRHCSGVPLSVTWKYNCTVSSVSYRDLVQNTQGCCATCAMFLPLCTVAMTVSAMCKFCSTVFGRYSNTYSLVILSAFAKLRKATIIFVMSVRPHGTTRPPLDGSSWNLIFEYF